MSSSPTHEFLIEAAIMLHRYGTPSHRLERVMGQVASALSVHGTFLYTPTALVISLASNDSGEATVVRRVNSGPVDVDKLIQFDDLLGLPAPWFHYRRCLWGRPSFGEWEVTCAGSLCSRFLSSHTGSGSH